MSDRNQQRLEPRVAKLEVGLDRLTDDVRDLAGVVRTQGSNMEQEIQKLIVAVTQAGAPRKTDWGTIIAGIALVMAIGSAVFWPLNQTAQDNKEATRILTQQFESHQKLDMHPVGQALLQRIEEQVATNKKQTEEMFTSHCEHDQKELDLLAAHFHEEVADIRKDFETLLNCQREKQELYIDKLYNRVLVLESENIKENDKEHEELLKWRQKAMGLDDQNVNLKK